MGSSINMTQPSWWPPVLENKVPERKTPLSSPEPGATLGYVKGAREGPGVGILQSSWVINMASFLVEIGSTRCQEGNQAP